jgi:hypothetical protein
MARSNRRFIAGLLALVITLSACDTDDNPVVDPTTPDTTETSEPIGS